MYLLLSLADLYKFAHSAFALLQDESMEANKGEETDSKARSRAQGMCVGCVLTLSLCVTCYHWLMTCPASRLMFATAILSVVSGIAGAVQRLRCDIEYETCKQQCEQLL